MLKWLKGTRRPPPVGSWAVFHPTVTVTAARTPTHHLNVQLSPHATFLQTRTLSPLDIFETLICAQAHTLSLSVL